MQLRFCADTLLCRHIFMQLRIYTAYAATLLGSPFMRSCFCAVMLFYADEAFTRSRFYAAEPFTLRNGILQTMTVESRFYAAASFTRRYSYTATFLCGCAFYAAMLLRCTGWKWFSGRTILRGKPQGYLRGWPCPCAALWVSRPSRPAPLPAGRRRWNPGRIFHGWRPWCAPAFPVFPAAG